MFEASASCLAPNYSDIVRYPVGVMSLASQLNYLMDIVSNLKAELAKIKAEVKEIKNQLAVTHLYLINEIRHSGKSYLSISTCLLYTSPSPRD